jgi:hypothetical protein
MGIILYRSASRSPLPAVPQTNNHRAVKTPTRASTAVQRAATKRIEQRLSGPPLIYRGGAGDSSERFMDRDFMQQMQRRLLEQHEDTLRRRIHERQVSHGHLCLNLAIYLQ